MNWGPVIRESLTTGALLGIIITMMIIVSLKINKEMWLRSYPPDVKARWGPMSSKAKRQRIIFALLFFGVLIAAMTYDVIRLEAVLGRPPSFLAIFAGNAIVLALFNLVDAVIIDWLILQVLWPSLGVLPGTEGMPGYKDGRLWAINLLKGFVMVPILGGIFSIVASFLIR